MSCLQHCDLGLNLSDGEERQTPLLDRLGEDSVDEDLSLGAELAVNRDRDRQLGSVSAVI